MASRRQSKPMYNTEVESFIAQHKRRAENLIISEFPRRVVELNALLNTEQFSAETLVRLLQDARKQRGVQSATPASAATGGETDQRPTETARPQEPLIQVASQRGKKALGDQDGNTEEASDAAPGGTEASSGGGGAATTVITHLGDGAGEPDEAATGRRADKRKHDQVDGATCTTTTTTTTTTPGRVGSRRTSLRAHVESMIDVVRPHLLAMLEHADCVGLWLQLLAPKEEDATNVGLGALMAATFTASGASTAAVDWLDTLKTYREERVAVEEAWNERAVVDDFHRAHVDLDRTQFDYMRQSVYDMRDRYAAIHDLVTKNWRLLKQPRTGERLSYN